MHNLTEIRLASYGPCSHGLGELTASEPIADLTLTALTASVDVERRIIEGVLIPPDADVNPANTSAGLTIFAHGSLTWPADLRRVKLLREHQQGDSLGYAIALSWTPELGLVGRFKVVEGPNGDRALQDAVSGIRDGLSVGPGMLQAARGRDGIVRVTGGVLREASLVSVPAWDDSRVTSVLASHSNQKGSAMKCLICQVVHAPGVTTCTPEALTAAGILSTVTPPAPVATPPAQGPPAVTQLTASELQDAIRTALAEGNVTPAVPPLGGPNQAPGNTPPAAGGLGLAQFVELVAGHNLGNGDPVQLRAALSDIIPADSPSAFRPTYLTELWDGSPYRRKFIDNATTVRPLPRTMKIVGQKWSVAPAVADYTGNKAEVPSNEPVLVDVEVNVARYAGAHDVDRAYIDLGSPEWLTSYFEAQTESAAKLGDMKAAAAAYAGATQLDSDAGTGGVQAYATLLAGVVAGVVAAASVGEDVDYVAMAPGLIAELFAITNDDAPAFFGGAFQLGGGGDGALGGVTWFTTPGLTGKQFLVGSKAAVRWHEMTPPVRVQALNVANGGIDLGVFGYYATYVRNAAQIRKGTVT